MNVNESSGNNDKKRYVFTRADCMHYLQEKAVAAKSAAYNTKKPNQFRLVRVILPPHYQNLSLQSSKLQIYI